ncbi:MAG: BspA family leucine-rich repeat surface protein, partial [Bacteroidales bacterium]|nr:BspA family leucine-rich repeat surface protein [Bacteroidales bacterium]
MTKKVFFQKTVLMLAFLFVGWSAMATNYIVRGAGTSACNGTYTETGVYNGKPYYLYNSGGTMYGISWLGTKWGISKTTNGAVADTRNTYYTNTSTSSTPPETGWVKTFGTTPIPTVIRESGNLHYSSAMFFENINNDGGIQSKVFITHDNFGGQTFDGTISEDFVASGKAIVNNVPAGLTAQIILKDDLTVELSFTGNVLSHTVSNNISNLEVIFNDDAFTGSDPANVNKSTKSDFAIYFSNNILQVPSEYSTIAAAIAAASPYDIIQIAAGTYTEPGLAVNKELTFVGEDPSTTIVQAHADYNVATDRVFNILNVPAVKVSRFFNLTIQNGKVNASGAGIRIFSSLEMFNCIITNNISIGNSGAGISCNNLLLDGCLISNNLVNGGGQIRGVGVAAQSAFITNCTFSGNTHISTGADWNKGAAIYLSGEYSTSTIVNSTITNNSCSGTSSDTRGGGICIDIRTELNLKNCIIYGNTAIKGADLYRDNEFYVNKINAYNSIIGVMAAYSGDAINGYNVNVSSADPLLVALADNGGPSQTCALQIGSPAIDAGLHGITETDQRGYYANGIRDIGAFEYEGIDPSSQPLQLVFTTTAANQVVKIPLKGTVDVTVDWGDGNSDTWTTATNAAHSYLSAGTYTVSISGTLTGLGRSSSYLNEFKNYLTKVISWGDVGLEDLSNAFNYCTLLTEVPNNLPVTVTNLSKTFISATGFNGDISNWNTSSVTTMEAMFADADLFNQDIGNWDVSNVENMSWMFSGADNFNQDISNWNVSNVTNMSGMFDYAPVFNQDISSWNTASVTDMSWMFDAGTPGANAFDQNISNWDISSVTTMEGMFANVTLSTTNYDAILIGWASQT